MKVSNAAGKSIAVTDGMRLYSGYTVATEKDSYAYVSLDSTKAVKLDASSKAEVQKSGKKLELRVIAGKLFFNVTAPVEKDESLNIRTSTMVTGVRGTSGWVEVTDRFTSRVHLLEGTLTVTSSEPATGQMRQATITSGQTATATLKGLAQAGSQMALTVTAMQEKLVPGFVAVEVAADPALQQKIGAKSPLSVPLIIGDAEQRLTKEQKDADAAQKTLEQQLGQVGADAVDQVFESKTEDNDNDSGSAPAPTPTPDPEPDPSRVDLNGPTAAVLKATLETPGVTRVTVTNAGANDLSTESYTVLNSQTLDIRSGTFDVGSGRTLTVAGALSNSGTMNVAGKADITGSAENNGTITITSANSLHVAGTLTNNGTIQVGDASNPGLLDIQAGGQLVNNSGKRISVAETGSVTNSGTFTNAGEVSNSGSFSVNGGAPFICTGTYTENRRDQLYAMTQGTDYTVRYLGPVAKLPGWYADTKVTLMGADNGTLNTDTALTVSGAVLDLNGRTVTMSGTWTVKGELTIQNFESGGLLSGAGLSGYGFNNKGTLTMNGVSTDCPLHNSGTLTLTNSSVMVSSDRAITNDGSAAVTTVAGSSTVSSDASAASADIPGVAIYNQGRAALYVEGGVVSGGSGVGIEAHNGCNVLISGGEVTSTSGDSVFLVNSALTLESGKITSVSGLGISVYSDVGGDESGDVSSDVGGGSVTMTGGEVTTTGGTAISVSGGEVLISGGTVETSSGAGIEMTGGTVTVDGGKVSSEIGQGARINGGTLTLTGGEISCISGNGINVGNSTNGSGTVIISGGTVTSIGAEGIHVIDSGSLTMENGTVSGGDCGISVSGKGEGKVGISGGTVNGGNYGVYVSNDSKTIPEITGTAVITLTKEAGYSDVYPVFGQQIMFGGDVTLKAKDTAYFGIYRGQIPDEPDGEYYILRNPQIKGLL